jgi:hypothetical protein
MRHFSLGDGIHNEMVIASATETLRSERLHAVWRMLPKVMAGAF